MRDWVILPRILQSAQEERETSSAVREADFQLLRQFVERAAEDHRNNAELRFRGHAHGPRHHVFRHALRTEHIPGMDQHSRAFIGAMMKECPNAGIVEVLSPTWLPICTPRCPA